MARPIWSGALNFGLVTVPVELYSATEDHTIHFRQFERGTSDRIRYRRVNERTGKEVPYEDIVKGYELDNGEYVLVDREELEQIAPGKSRTIDIEAFVDLGQIDPMFFQKSYWLAPAKEEFNRAYGLLIEAMGKTNRAGVATFVMRGKEYVAAVRAGDNVLALDTLHFAADIRDPAKELRKLPEAAPARGKEVDMAVSLIESMSEEWQPEEFRDTYTERVRQLIEDKKAGRTVTAESAPAEPTTVVDLFDALSRSVRGRKGGEREQGDARKRQDKRQGRGQESRQDKQEKADVGEMTKAELENMARDLEIKGRSKMSRDELEKAVKAASRPKRRKAS